MSPLSDATPDEQVFILLSQTYALARKLSENELAKSGITIAEYSLLRIIENTAGVTASEARKRLFTSAPSLAQLVRNLKRKGMIKTGSHRTDTRKQPLYLTWRGARTVKAAHTAIRKTLTQLNVPEKALTSLSRDLSVLFSLLSPYGE